MSKEITMASVCIPSEDVVAREIEGDMIIVPLASGIGDADDELYTLNDTGKAIWERLDGEKTLGQVAEALAENFSSPGDTIKQDVLGFVTEMVRRKIIAVADSD